MSVIKIRPGDEADVDIVNAFYSANGDSARVAVGERFVLAEDSKQLVGVVRLCNEHGHSVLRTMRVKESYRRQGIGKQMLEMFECLLPLHSECYCLPYTHLTAFYARIGFDVIPAQEAPQHLQDRHHRYCEEGTDVCVMKRSADRSRDRMRGKVFGLLRPQTGHFRYASGHHSDRWFDLEDLCSRPREVRPFAIALARQLAQYNIDGVCGPLNEGAFLSLMVASELDVEFSYSERFDTGRRDILYPVQYRIPKVLRQRLSGKRIAIVNDVISAGSAVRSTIEDLAACGARPYAIGALLILGDSFLKFSVGNPYGFALQSLAFAPNNLWEPAQCPLCLSRVPLEEK
jgi:orotate phosphoribosyltransferase